MAEAVIRDTKGKRKGKSKEGKVCGEYSAERQR